MRLAAAFALLLVASLSACSAPPSPQPAPTPTFTFTSEATVVSGSGPEDIPLAIPDGAQSLEITATCTGTIVSLGLGGFMGDDRFGPCGGVSSFVIPISEASQGTLRVFVADGALFTLQLQFSADPLIPDPIVADQCSTIGEVLSTIRNAGDAVRFGDADLVEWRVEMDGAVEQLATIDPDTMIGHLAVPVSDWLSSPASAPDQLPADVSGAEGLIGQLCATNGSTVAITAQYGG